MHLVLSHIHSQMLRLPKTVELSTLYKFAMIVARYKLHGAIRWVSEQWLQPLRNIRNWANINHAYCWLLVSWVFQLPSDFALAANAVVGYSKQLNDGVPKWTDGKKLPLPAAVHGK